MCPAGAAPAGAAKGLVAGGGLNQAIVGGTIVLKAAVFHGEIIQTQFWEMAGERFGG